MNNARCSRGPLPPRRDRLLRAAPTRNGVSPPPPGGALGRPPGPGNPDSPAGGPAAGAGGADRHRDSAERAAGEAEGGCGPSTCALHTHCRARPAPQPLGQVHALAGRPGPPGWRAGSSPAPGPPPPAGRPSPGAGAEPRGLGHVLGPALRRRRGCWGPGAGHMLRSPAARARGGTAPGSRGWRRRRGGPRPSPR